MPLHTVFLGCIDSTSSSHEVESSDAEVNLKQPSLPAPKRRRRSERRSRRSFKATPSMMPDSLSGESESGSGASDDQCTVTTESPEEEAKSGMCNRISSTFATCILAPML